MIFIFISPETEIDLDFDPLLNICFIHFFIGKIKFYYLY